MTVRFTATAAVCISCIIGCAGKAVAQGHPAERAAKPLFDSVKVQDLPSDEHDPAVFNETSLRWDKVFGKSFAVNINGTYSMGTDWYADSSGPH
ncbi:hypothetical protein [Flavihumibacter petaseus]|nr:hypothetical protein [Flavihumibacter petaseus]